MKRLDRWLQDWRIHKAIPFVRDGDRLLDIGCFDRTLIDRVLDRVNSATGIDPHMEPATDGKVQILRGSFPADFDFEPDSFDCISILAVLEHVEDPRALARECHRILAPEGRVVITVPHPFVDEIIDLGMRLRVLDGMAFEEHHGYDAGLTVSIFMESGFRTPLQSSFQLGLNRLFVFKKSAG